MPFSFTKLRQLIISKSPMYSIDGIGHQISIGSGDIRVFEERMNLTLRSEDVTPWQELHQGSGYRTHAARIGSRVVALKVFQGPHAQQDWAVTVTFARHLMHPRLLHMIATSRPDQNVRFIVFSGEFQKRMELLVASALSHDLTRSVILGWKMIHGISSALNYLSSQNIALLSIGIENFEIYVDDDEQVVVGISPTGLHNYYNHRQSSVIISRNGSEIDVLNAICQRAFKNINQVLYQESLDRDHNIDLGLSSSDQLESHSESYGHSTDSTGQQANPSPSEAIGEVSRREFVWLSTKENPHLSLKDVSEQFGNFLGVHLSSQQTLPLRRFRARGARVTPHRCQGYSREEIDLATDISSSAIVLFGTPAPMEICSICGEIVQEAEIFKCICNRDDDVSKPNIKCATCFTWQHRDCVSLPKAGEQYTCFECSVAPTGLRESAENLDEIFMEMHDKWLNEGSRSLGDQDDDSRAEGSNLEKSDKFSELQSGSSSSDLPGRTYAVDSDVAYVGKEGHEYRAINKPPSPIGPSHEETQSLRLQPYALTPNAPTSPSGTPPFSKPGPRQYSALGTSATNLRRGNLERTISLIREAWRGSLQSTPEGRKAEGATYT